METTSTTYYRCLACGECFFTESSFARHSRTVHCKVLVCRGHDAEPSGETFLRHALSLAAVKMEPPDDIAEDRPCASASAPARDDAYGVHATDDGSDAISSDPVVVTTDDGGAACAGPVAADDDKGMIALEECGFLAADLRAGAPLPAAASRLEDFLSGIAPASRDERGNPARGRDDACKRRRHETHDNNGGGGGGGGGGDLARGRPPQAGLGMDGGALSVHAREDATWDRVAADDGAGAGGRLDYEHVESLLRDELPLSSIGGWPQLAPEWPPDEPPPPPPPRQQRDSRPPGCGGGSGGGSGSGSRHATTQQQQKPAAKYYREIQRPVQIPLDPDLSAAFHQVAPAAASGGQTDDGELPPTPVVMSVRSMARGPPQLVDVEATGSGGDAGGEMQAAGVNGQVMVGRGPAGRSGGEGQAAAGGRGPAGRVVGESCRCTQCDAVFSKSSLLKRHVNTCHSPSSMPLYACAVCRMTFRHASTVKAHMRVHGGDARAAAYKCHVCSAAFMRVTQLKSHGLVHSGERPHRCDTCGATFARLGGLYIHNRLHTGQKPFKCDVCGKEFSDVSGYKSHYRSHTGEKPFKCPLCGAAFKDRSGLNQHKKRHAKYLLTCT